MSRPHNLSNLKRLGAGHAPVVSKIINQTLGGERVKARAGGVTVQSAHDGVLVLISHRSAAQPHILLALQRAGFIYTVSQHPPYTHVKVTHRKVI